MWPAAYALQATARQGRLGRYAASRFANRSLGGLRVYSRVRVSQDKTARPTAALSMLSPSKRSRPILRLEAKQKIAQRWCSLFLSRGSGFGLRRFAPLSLMAQRARRVRKAAQSAAVQSGGSILLRHPKAEAQSVARPGLRGRGAGGLFPPWFLAKGVFASPIPPRSPL